MSDDFFADFEANSSAIIQESSANAESTVKNLEERQYNSFVDSNSTKLGAVKSNIASLLSDMKLKGIESHFPELLKDAIPELKELATKQEPVLEYKTNSGEVLVFDLVKVTGPEEIKGNCCVSPDNPRAFFSPKDTKDINESIIKAGGNKEPGFAHPGPNGLDELFEGQRRQSACITQSTKEKPLTFSYYRCRTRLNDEDVMLESRSLQDTKVKVNLISRAFQLKRNFVSRKYKTITEAILAENLCHKRHQKTVVTLSRLPESLLYFYEDQLDIGLGFLNNASFEPVLASLADFIGQVENSPKIKEVSATYSGLTKSKNHSVTHNDSLIVQEAYQTAYESLWNLHKEGISQTYTELFDKWALDNNVEQEVREAPLDIVIQLMKLTLSKVLNPDSDASEKKASPKVKFEPVQIAQAKNTDRDPVELKRTGSKKKPKLTLTMPDVTEDELEAFQKHIESFWS